VEKRKRKHTMKSMLQPLETSMELAIPRMPNAKSGGMPVAVKLSEIGQRLDLGVVFLDLNTLRCAKLIYLGVIFRREDLLVLG
jgi:hypothetical protein